MYQVLTLKKSIEFLGDVIKISRGDLFNNFSLQTEKNNKKLLIKERIQTV
jgi:hypothetical protein